MQEINPLSVETRPARPEDAVEGAHLILASGPELLCHSFGRPVDQTGRLLAELWPSPGHTFSYTWSHVATVGGAVQGLLLAYPGRQLPRVGLATARLLVSRLHWRELLVMAWRSLAFASASGSVPRSDFYIAHLAVLPAAQGQGIGSRLLALADELARLAGCVRCALDVFRENERACAVYARAGYTAVRSARTPYGIIQRMVKRL